jgi:hypothetical protein
MAQTFKLLGVDDLDAALKDFSEKAVKRIIRKGLSMAADNTCQEAERIAPVKTGQLQESIWVRPIKRNKRYFGFKVELGAGDYTGHEFYGSFVEYGHHVGRAGAHVRWLRRHGQKDLADATDRRKWLEGKHFLKAAFDTTASASREIALGQIRLGIAREVKRLERAARKASREST